MTQVVAASYACLVRVGTLGRGNDMATRVRRQRLRRLWAEHTGSRAFENRTTSEHAQAGALLSAPGSHLGMSRDAASGMGVGNYEVSMAAGGSYPSMGHV